MRFRLAPVAQLRVPLRNFDFNVWLFGGRHGGLLRPYRIGDALGQSDRRSQKQDQRPYSFHAGHSSSFSKNEQNFALLGMMISRMQIRYPRNQQRYTTQIN